MRFRSLALSFLFSVFLLGLTACPHHRAKKHHAEGCEAPSAATPMAVGQTLFVPFPPDGEWHDSGILALAGDSMLIEARGIAKGLPQGAVLYRVGDNLPLDVKGGQSVEFENMGPLQFRAIARESKHVPGLLEVGVTKNAGPKE